MRTVLHFIGDLFNCLFTGWFRGIREIAHSTVAATISMALGIVLIAGFIIHPGISIAIGKYIVLCGLPAGYIIACIIHAIILSYNRYWDNLMGEDKAQRESESWYNREQNRCYNYNKKTHHCSYYDFNTKTWYEFSKEEDKEFSRHYNERCGAKDQSTQSSGSQTHSDSSSGSKSQNQNAGTNSESRTYRDSQSSTKNGTNQNTGGNNNTDANEGYKSNTGDDTNQTSGSSHNTSDNSAGSSLFANMTDEEAKRAYKNMMRTFHPDNLKTGNAEAAQRINEEYQNRNK